MAASQPELTNDAGQWEDNGMLARRRAGIGGVHHLAPPLQTDLAQHRLGHGLANAGDLVIEGIKRQQRLAPISGSK